VRDSVRIDARPSADPLAYEREARRNEQLQILHRVQSSVARLGDPMRLAQSAAETIRKTVPELAVTISLIDRARGELVVRAHAGATTLPEEAHRIPLAGGGRVEAEVAASGLRRSIPDLGGVPGVRPLGRGSRSALHLPILCSREIVGVLTIEAPRPGAFGDEEMATYEAVAGILGVAVDNARLFERVEQEKEDWARTFDAITDMVSIHDQEFRLLRGNRALTDRAGAPAYALSGRTCADVYSEIAGVTVECPHAESERLHRPVSREIERPDGGAFRLTALPCFASGRLVYSVHLCEDITEERRLREQLLQSEKMSAVGQLVSGVAHELNNPLAGVMGYTQLMMSRPIDPKLRNDLERVFNEAQRAAKIVQNLLTFARKHKPEKRYLGLNGIIEKTLELRAYEMKVSNIVVETAFDPVLPRTLLDFHQMQQVILNIVTNAEQAMLEAHGRGRLAITTRGRGDHVEVRFQDDGPGIPPEHLSRVFDPFFTTKPVGKGTGLGLSICDGIVKEHGGILRVESSPGRGAAFVIELPILGEEGSPDPSGASPPARTEAAGRFFPDR